MQGQNPGGGRGPPNQVIAGSKGIKEYRRFPDSSSQGQKYTCKYSTGSSRKGDPYKGLQFCSTQGKAAFPEGGGNGFYSLLGGSYQGWQNHHCNSKGAGEKSYTHTKDLNEKDMSEDSKDN